LFTFSTALETPVGGLVLGLWLWLLLWLWLFEVGVCLGEIRGLVQSGYRVKSGGIVVRVLMWVWGRGIEGTIEGDSKRQRVQRHYG